VLTDFGKPDMNGDFLGAEKGVKDYETATIE
jgi:hypothetical protein